MKYLIKTGTQCWRLSTPDGSFEPDPVRAIHDCILEESIRPANGDHDKIKLHAMYAYFDVVDPNYIGFVVRREFLVDYDNI